MVCGVVHNTHLILCDELGMSAGVIQKFTSCTITHLIDEHDGRLVIGRHCTKHTHIHTHKHDNKHVNKQRDNNKIIQSQERGRHRQIDMDTDRHIHTDIHTNT